MRKRSLTKLILLPVLLALAAALVLLALSRREKSAEAAMPAPTQSESASAPTATPAPTPELAPEPTAEPTPEPTPDPTPEPTPDMSPLGAEFFNDAVFLGDSTSHKLEVYTYGHDDIGEPDFITQSSYSVRNAVYNKGKIYFSGKTVPLGDLIEKTGATRLFILLGMNDLGILGVDRTMENWEIFYDMLREMNPTIDIYIQSLTPMYGAAQSPTLNNAMIDEYNERLRAFAEEKGCCFVEIAQVFKDEDGNLIDALTEDHYVHFNTEGCVLWAQALRDPANYSMLKR